LGFALGIVLSGGGARGIAHVGALQALAENGIRPDCVAGSSSGALVGALYAAGHSTETMLRFFETKSPFRLSRLSLGKPGLIDTAKVAEDFREYFPDDRFESLATPLFVTATDIVHARPRVFDSGPLIAPVVASCAVPMVFTPTEIDGSWYADGGIIDNFPVEALRHRCQRLIGVYASPLKAVARRDLRSSLAISQRALEVGMFFRSEMKFAECDVLICPDELSPYATFDTHHVRQIFEIGHRATLAQIDAIQGAPLA
jgi:NTE family protein